MASVTSDGFAEIKTAAGLVLAESIEGVGVAAWRRGSGDGFARTTILSLGLQAPKKDKRIPETMNLLMWRNLSLDDIAEGNDIR